VEKELGERRAFGLDRAGGGVRGGSRRLQLLSSAIVSKVRQCGEITGQTGGFGWAAGKGGEVLRAAAGVCSCKQRGCSPSAVHL
jgi:hypothetical protein